MKLAEALILRKDLQTRLMALRAADERRPGQEGDPRRSRRPFFGIDRMTQELQSLITRINLTNSKHAG